MNKLLPNSFYRVSQIRCKFRTQIKLLSESSSPIKLTLNVPCISESCIEIKIKLNFYFHTSLWCLKRFYEDLKGFHKTL